MTEKKKYFYKRKKKNIVKQKDSDLEPETALNNQKTAEITSSVSDSISKTETSATQSDKSLDKPENSSLAEKITDLTKDLFYISETDAEIEFFEAGRAQAVSAENLQLNLPEIAGKKITEQDFENFFGNLTKIESWFGDEEKQTAEKFTQLKNLLEGNLRDLKVFKVGKTQVDIYVAGLSSDGVLCGIKTKAIET